MASVTVYSVSKIDDLIAGDVVGAAIVGGHLVLTLRDDSTIDVGAVVTSLVDATLTSSGVVELATDTETIAGTDGGRVVTPLGLAAKVATSTAKGVVELATDAETSTGTDTTRAVTPANLLSVLPASQRVIGTLSPANDDVIQRKSGAWANRTLAQLATDLATTGEFPDMMLYNGSSYADADGAKVYVGTADPGAVSNGSVWFDTTP